MTTKHSPGPWSWGDGFRGLYSSADRQAEGDVMTWRKYEGMWLTLGPSREANARLIAAAPELLEALKAARKEILWWEREHPCCAGASNKRLAKIEAAIAKATGAQQ